MNLSNETLTILTALIGTLFINGIIPILKFVGGWWKARHVDALEDRKLDVEENVSFAKEWRELYKQTEEKVSRLENLLGSMRTQNESLYTENKKIAEDKLTLEDRVKLLEMDFERMKKAFDFLALTVSETHPDAVKTARKIMTGEL